MNKQKKLFIDIITIFPQLFENFLNEALIARAQKKGLVAIKAHNLRKWTTDNHKTVDGRPYGGGAGMVLMVEPILKAVNALKKKTKAHVVVFSAKGKKFDQATARKWAKRKRIIFICGRYEGIDERVNKYIADEEVSIGDYVLFGGEIPAMVVTEAVVRLLPGAVGKQKSIEDESFKEISGIESKMMKEFIEYPHFTRPEKIKIAGKIRTVPEVLLSGNHKNIETWREEESKNMIKQRQP